MYEVFIAECKKEMSLRKWKHKDLAKATGFKLSTIYTFFTDIPNRDKSQNVARAISKALNIDL